MAKIDNSTISQAAHDLGYDDINSVEDLKALMEKALGGGPDGGPDDEAMKELGAILNALGISTGDVADMDDADDAGDVDGSGDVDDDGDGDADMD